MTKPFSMRELRARIRAQLRRAARSSQQTHRFGECEVDFDRAELRRAGRLVDVTPQELRLLAVLLRNRGRVFSRDQLIASAWGQGVAITDRVVDTHVFNLRKKIEPDPARPRFLVGVRLGYRFADEDRDEEEIDRIFTRCCQSIDMRAQRLAAGGFDEGHATTLQPLFSGR